MRNSKTRAIRENQLGLDACCGENVRKQVDPPRVGNHPTRLADTGADARADAAVVSVMCPIGAVVEVTQGLRKCARGVVLEMRPTAFFGVPDYAVQFEDGQVRILRGDFLRRMG